MWPSLSVLSQLPSLLRELLQLQREQCGLLRELITYQGRSPQTPATPRVFQPTSPPPPKLRTEKDVQQVTRQTRSRWDREQAQREATRQTAIDRAAPDLSPQPQPQSLSSELPGSLTSHPLPSDPTA